MLRRCFLSLTWRGHGCDRADEWGGFFLFACNVCEILCCWVKKKKKKGHSAGEAEILDVDMTSEC